MWTSEFLSEECSLILVRRQQSGFSCPAVNCRTPEKLTAASEQGLKSTPPTKTQKFTNVLSCEHFQYFQTLLNLPNTLLDQFDPHTTEAIIYQNCTIIDKSRHWSLLLYKESLHIHRQKPELNHGTKASKELVIFN